MKQKEIIDYHYLQDFLQVAYKDHVQPQLCLSAHSVEKMIPHFASHQGKYGCYCKEAEKKFQTRNNLFSWAQKAIIKMKASIQLTIFNQTIKRVLLAGQRFFLCKTKSFWEFTLRSEDTDR